MPIDQSTLDAAVGPGIGDELQANRAQLAGLKPKREAMEADRAAAEAKAAEIQGQTAEAVNQDRKKLADLKPRESSIPEPKAPDFSSNEPSPEQFQKTAGMLMAVMGLVGVFSRSGYTSALNNMTAALQGFQEGNAESTKKHLDEFHSQVTDFKTKLEALKSDRAALEKMDQHDIQAIQQQMEFDAHKNDLPLLAQTARTKSLTEGLKSYDSQIKEIQKAVEHAETIQQGMRKILVQHSLKQDQSASGGGSSGDGGADNTALDLPARQYLKTGQLPPGMGKQAVAYRKQVIARANALMGSDGANAQDVVTDRAGFKADASSLSKQTQRADAIDAGMRKIENDIKTIDSTIADGNAGFSKWLNKPLNALRTQNSDPKLAAYALSVKQVGTEYERMLQGGQLSSAQLHQGASEDAKKILNEDMSVEEVRAVIPVMIREMENARRATNDQLHEIRTRLHSAAPHDAAPAAPVQPFSDAEKEKRYQAWRASHGGAQ
jgi:hypothetical protein